MANHTSAIRGQGVCGRLRYPNVDASEWGVVEDAGGERCACARRAGTTKLTIVWKCFVLTCCL